MVIRFPDGSETEPAWTERKGKGKMSSRKIFLQVEAFYSQGQEEKGKGKGKGKGSAEGEGQGQIEDEGKGPGKGKAKGKGPAAPQVRNYASLSPFYLDPTNAGDKGKVRGLRGRDFFETARARREGRTRARNRERARNPRFTIIQPSSLRKRRWRPSWTGDVVREGVVGRLEPLEVSGGGASSSSSSGAPPTTSVSGRAAAARRWLWAIPDRVGFMLRVLRVGSGAPPTTSPLDDPDPVPSTFSSSSGNLHPAVAAALMAPPPPPPSEPPPAALAHWCQILSNSDD